MPKLALPAARLRVLSSSSTAGRGFTSSPKCRLAQARHGILNEPWLPLPAATTLPVTYFSPGRIHRSIDGLGNSKQDDHKPPDERKLKLGNTLETLRPLLPTIFYNSIPSDIVSPSVNLHLFPSTHPHLPIVRGHSMYRVALWTAPVAWNAIPLIGNVKLQILSERMLDTGTILAPQHGRYGCGNERLVVHWKTEPRTDSKSSPKPPSMSKDSSPSAEAGSETHDHLWLSPSEKSTNSTWSKLLGGKEGIFNMSKEAQFTGIFIFSFDEQGRILTITLDHSEEADGWDRTAAFVALTDWLLGKARGSLDPTPNPGLAMDSCGEYGIPGSNTRYPRRS